MPKRSVGEVFRRGRFYSIRYYDAQGTRRRESVRSEKREDAERTLRKRLQAKDDGLPAEPQVGKLRFEEGAKDLINDYTINGKRSLKEATRRVDKHLRPFFCGRRLSCITTADIRAFINERQQAIIVTGKGQNRSQRSVSNAEINRELTTLKRIFSLAIEGGKLRHKPHVPLLRENNVRTGFFEDEQFRSVRAHLPPAIQPVVTFAYITGWRIASEVLPLQWRQVDLRSGDIRLDSGTTKNGEGRLFKMSDDLRSLLQERRREATELERKHGQIIPSVFFRLVAEERGGALRPKPIRAFTKAWKHACRAAGCPGRIPHDLRRTAIRNMVRRGVPERVAMTLTGHKTRSVFERYNIVSEGDLSLAATRLDGLMGPSTREANASRRS